MGHCQLTGAVPRDYLIYPERTLSRYCSYQAAFLRSPLRLRLAEALRLSRLRANWRSRGTHSQGYRGNPSHRAPPHLF